MSRPRIIIMGDSGPEEIPWDEIPTPPATELADHFKQVRISPKAIDQISKIVPAEHYTKEGIHSWTQKRADFVFGKLSSSETKGKLRSLLYTFSFDADGPVLESVGLSL